MLKVLIFFLLSVTQDDFEHKMGDIICAIGSESSARSAISQSSDCYDIYKLGLPLPGVYDLKSLGSVQCLQGGWTSIQHRGQYGNPKNYFSKNWIDYVQGFGRPGIYTAVYIWNLNTESGSGMNRRLSSCLKSTFR